MKVEKESEKAGLKLNIQKMKIMVSSPIPSWQIDEETVQTVTDFISFSALIAVAKTSKTVLNSNGESGHPCLVPDFRGNEAL